LPRISEGGEAIAGDRDAGCKRMILQRKSRAVARLFLTPSFRGACETSEPGISGFPDAQWRI
jgi:hypothetical protein